MNETTAPPPPPTGEQEPSYGPRGYLPERAARRARKIILREQMGLGWPLAAVGAGIVLAVVAIAFLLRSGPPGPPYAPAGQIEAIGRNSARTVAVEGGGEQVLAVRGGGAVRTFVAPSVEVRFCEESRRLESVTGAVWTLDGILVGGEGESLRPAASVVVDGMLYVDTDSMANARPVPAGPRGETPACTG